MRRDNYHRNLNPKILETLHWLPRAAREALDEDEIEIAVALSNCWESKMHKIFQECYPDEKEFRESLLSAVASMRLMVMPGAMKAMSTAGDVPQDIEFLGGS